MSCSKSVKWHWGGKLTTVASIPTHCVRTSVSVCAGVVTKASLQPRHVEENSRIAEHPSSFLPKALICLCYSLWLGSFAWPTYTIYVVFVSLRMVAVKEHISVARESEWGEVLCIIYQQANKFLPYFQKKKNNNSINPASFCLMNCISLHCKESKQNMNASRSIIAKKKSILNQCVVL